MSVSRLTAILFIFCGCTFAWFVLGVSVGHRTGEYDHMLEAEVMRLWGGRHVQGAPQAWIQVIEERTETVEGEPCVVFVSRSRERLQNETHGRSVVDFLHKF